MPDVPTLASYLTDWLEVQRTRLQPSTLASYRGNVERYLVPGLGQRRLDELTAHELTVFYARLLREGGLGGKPLSARTVQYCHAVLHRALSDAEKHGLVERNVAALADCPRRDPDAADDDHEFQVWTPEETRAFLAFIVGHRLREICEVAIGTGMRRGEILGLRWGDVDLDSRRLHVRRSLSVVDGVTRLKRTKTNRSRTITVDDLVVAALRRTRQRQEEARAAAGQAWANTWSLVFTDAAGAPVNPFQVTYEFGRLVREAPVPVVRFHDLRHLHATAMLASGVPVPVVSQRLGHTNVAMTLNVYAHVLPAMDVAAVDRFVAHLYGDEASPRTARSGNE